MTADRLLQRAERELLDAVAQAAVFRQRCAALGLELAVTEIGAWMSYEEDIQDVRRQFYHHPGLVPLLQRVRDAYRTAGIDLLCLGLERMGDPTSLAPNLQLLNE